MAAQTPARRASLLSTEAITARQDQSCVQKIMDDSVSKDTRMTSKRGEGQIRSCEPGWVGWGAGWRIWNAVLWELPQGHLSLSGTLIFPLGLPPSLCLALPCTDSGDTCCQGRAQLPPREAAELAPTCPWHLSPCTCTCLSGPGRPGLWLP